MVLAVAALLFQLAPVQALPAAAPQLAPAIASAPAPELPLYALATESTSPFGAARFEPASTTSTTSASTNSAGSNSNGLLASTATPQNSLSLSTIRLADPAPVKNVEIARPENMPSRKAWLALSFVQHGAAAFDAYSTRRAISHGAVEADPMMRPFVHSPGLYAAIQVGPVVLDLLSRKMQRSQNNFVRHMWWLPQSLATAEFMYAGVHNMRVGNQ